MLSYYPITPPFLNRFRHIVSNRRRQRKKKTKGGKATAAGAESAPAAANGGSEVSTANRRSERPLQASQRGVKLHVGSSQAGPGTFQRQGARPPPQSKGNRAKAEKTLLLLGRKEQELIYALEDLTDRVEEQHEIVDYCHTHAPQRLMAERMRERELEEDQVRSVVRETVGYGDNVTEDVSLELHRNNV